VVYNGVIYMTLDQSPADASMGMLPTDCQTEPIAPAAPWYVSSL
jgi:hypothetical protein